MGHEHPVLGQESGSSVLETLVPALAEYRIASPVRTARDATWDSAAVNNPVYGTAAPQRSCAGRAAQVQNKADPWQHCAVITFRRRSLRSRALGGHNASLVVTV